MLVNAGSRLAAVRPSHATSAAAGPARRAVAARRAGGRSAIAPPPRAAGGGGSWFDEGKQKFFTMLAGDYDAAAVNAIIDGKLAPGVASGKVRTV